MMDAQANDTMIVHLCSKTEWQTAEKLGMYRTASLGAEGFIHCSTPEQILDVAIRFYKGIPDLVLLWIDPAQVTSEIRWEAPMHPEGEPHALNAETGMFPHVYGPINLDAVLRVTDFG